MDNLAETLSWLVSIPSPTGEEAVIRDAISARLDRFPQTEILDSVVVGEPASGKVMLVGHIDTVPLQGETGARIEGDRLHGLGATDMKGGVAVMIHLLESLGDDGIVGVFYAGEEGPVADNQLVPVLTRLPVLLESNGAVVLEPTDREVQAGCNGFINATVVFVGEAAHSARPWLGVNAVTRAGGFLAEFDTFEPETHEIDGLPFREVVSVTRASGGIATNVIPSRFELNVNYRFAPDRTVDQAIEHLHALCSGADEFEVTDAAPAAHPDATNPLFQSIAAAGDALITHKQGWTDVAQLVQRGLPAVNFGPGEGALAHKPGESVRLSDLDWAYDTLHEVLS